MSALELVYTTMVNLAILEGTHTMIEIFLS